MFGCFWFTALKSQKPYPLCCIRQILAIQQKRGTSIIAGQCHSWRSSSDRYLVALSPSGLSSLDIWWILYLSNARVRTIEIIVILEREGDSTDYFASWSCDVWVSPKYWCLWHYGISILCISVWGKKVFPCGSLLSKCHLRGSFTFFSSSSTKWQLLWHHPVGLRC